MEFTGKTRQLLILLLLLPSVAYGTLTVTDRGVGGNTTSEASTAMSPSSPGIAAGSTGVLIVAGDNAVNATRNFPLDVTDSKGNAWHLFASRAPAITQATGVEFGMYVATKLTATLGSGDNVTITYSSANVAAKAYTFTEIAPTAGNVALSVTTTSPVTNSLAAATSSTFTPPGNLSIGNVVVAGAGLENGTDSFTPDSDTTNGTWSTAQRTSVGSSTTGMTVISQAKVQTTAVSQQSYDLTFTSNDISFGGLLFKEVADATRAMQTSPSTSSASFTIKLGRSLAVGSMGLLCGTSDNASVTNPGADKVWPSSITDSVGNIWTLRISGICDPGATNAGAELAIYTAPITVAITANDSIPISAWDAGVSVAAKTACVYEFVPSAGQTFSYVSSGIGTNVASAAPTVTTGSMATGDIVIGLTGSEGSDTFVADSDTSNGSWSTMQAGATGGSAVSDIAIASQYKTATGAGTQTYNVGLTSADVVIGYATIRQASGQSATNGFFQY